MGSVLKLCWYQDAVSRLDLAVRITDDPINQAMYLPLTRKQLKALEAIFDPTNHYSVHIDGL